MKRHYIVTKFSEATAFKLGNTVYTKLPVLNEADAHVLEDNKAYVFRLGFPNYELVARIPTSQLAVAGVIPLKLTDEPLHGTFTVEKYWNPTKDDYDGCVIWLPEEWDGAEVEVKQI